ncbi:MAG: hypothetical protein KAT74_07015 [Candidatus Cloacimonetes bacterium]|nr:hypothetical protein [Candidatus Cloacimonadota bacterium]
MMFRKIVSMITLVAFISLSTSCATAKHKKPKTLPMKSLSTFQDKKPEVLSFTKTSGEYIELSEDNPGRIYNNNIVWWNVESFSVPLSEVKDIEIGFKNRWKGALRGFSYVAIPCVLLVTLAFYGFGEWDSDDLLEDVLLPGVVLGTSPSLAVGAPIGYAIGSKDRFIFITEIDSTSTKIEEKHKKK